MSPTHHVAMMPQPNARRVGEFVLNTGGWAMVKYSTQTRAVIWSWMIPYTIAAATQRRMIRMKCIGHFATREVHVMQSIWANQMGCH